MDKTIRSVRPTDLVALVSFDGKAFPNEARSRDRLGLEQSGPLPVSTFLEQWFSFGRDRHTWISVRGQQIKGLVSARNRSSSVVWEVDCLLVAACDQREERDVCLSLLDQLSEGAGADNVEKVFLRLPRDSALVDIVRQAGFAPYLTEHLYRLGERSRPALAAISLPDSLRRRSRTDDIRLFQLYSAAVPLQVRRAEAMTFREWRELRQRGFYRRGEKELVCEREGMLTAWLKLSLDRHLGQFELLVHPSYGEGVEPLVRFSLIRLKGKPVITSLVPEHQAGLRDYLQERNFEEVAEYTNLVKQLAVRLRQPSLVPARA